MKMARKENNAARDEPKLWRAVQEASLPSAVAEQASVARATSANVERKTPLILALRKPAVGVVLACCPGWKVEGARSQVEVIDVRSLRHQRGATGATRGGQGNA
jgi:hypothetical protein